MTTTNISRVILLSAAFAILTMPASAAKVPPTPKTAARPAADIQILDTLAGASLDGGDCIFPASDGTCKGAVSFRPVQLESQNPRSTPSKPKTQKPDDDRWELGLSLQPTQVPQNEKGA